ncbi:MAG: hypothetical protein ACM3U0_02025 [archaeon]
MSPLQTILALGALLLLSIVIIRMNDTSSAAEDVIYNSSFGVLATSLSTSVIEEANRKHFDSTTDTMFITDLAPLTDASRLGCETGEDPNNIASFNDFDDFNNYTKIDSSMPSAIFKISCRVGYVDDSNPDKFVNNKTWHKKLTVYVTSRYMHGVRDPKKFDTLKVSSIFSYWTSR